MTDDRDPTAADRIADYLGAAANNGLSFAGSERAITDSFSGRRVVFTLADLRTVLAEHRQMRETLDGLETQHGVALYPGGPVYILDEDRVESWRVTAHGYIQRRLVEQWQPEDEGKT